MKSTLLWPTLAGVATEYPPPPIIQVDLFPLTTKKT